MKKSIIVTSVVFALMFAGCNSSSNENKQTSDSQSFNLDTTKLASGEIFYQCEMHHEINSDKMGICPTCEMDLTELKKH